MEQNGMADRTFPSGRVVASSPVPARRHDARFSNGADVIGAALSDAGATTAFGIPGGEVLALIDGLAGAGIEFVLARHENAAGFMAEGLWHATGALPVLVATLGPGVANAVNVVANAGQDRVPLIFLTGCVDADVARSYTHQVFDHQAVLRPLVKGSFRVARARSGNDGRGDRARLVRTAGSGAYRRADLGG